MEQKEKVRFASVAIMFFFESLLVFLGAVTYSLTLVISGQNPWGYLFLVIALFWFALRFFNWQKNVKQRVLLQKLLEEQEIAKTQN